MIAIAKLVVAADKRGVVVLGVWVVGGDKKMRYMNTSTVGRENEKSNTVGLECKTNKTCVSGELLLFMNQ